MGIEEVVKPLGLPHAESRFNPARLRLYAAALTIPPELIKKKKRERRMAGRESQDMNGRLDCQGDSLIGYYQI